MVKPTFAILAALVLVVPSLALPTPGRDSELVA